MHRKWQSTGFIFRVILKLRLMRTKCSSWLTGIRQKAVYWIGAARLQIYEVVYYSHRRHILLHACRSLRCQVTKDLRNNHMECWVETCREMKKSAAVWSGRRRYRLIRNAASRKPSLGQVIKASDGTLIHSQQCRLAHVILGLLLMPANELMQVSSSNSPS